MKIAIPPLHFVFSLSPAGDVNIVIYLPYIPNNFVYIARK